MLILTRAVLINHFLSLFYLQTDIISVIFHHLMPCWMLNGALSVPAVSSLWFNTSVCINFLDCTFFLQHCLIFLLTNAYKIIAIIFNKINQGFTTF